MNDTTVKEPAIATAGIEWVDGAPVSALFGDVYFSRDNGLAETRHVFIDQNDLPARFRALDPGSHFVVAESGFGTGLNFFATCQAWHQYAPGDATLHFISFECNPLTIEDFARACALWPELAVFYTLFLEHYPSAVGGLNRLRLDDGRIRLSLFYGDASEGLQQMEFVADAWYLDGFSPAKNPELWQHTLFRHIARHSRHGTTMATYTIARAVRNSLEQAGFDYQRVPGIGHKREVLRGSFLQAHRGSDVHGNAKHHAQSQHRADYQEPVVIIGAGIAGLLLARNLAERGIAVEVVSQAEAPADGASGNAQAAIYVKLGVDFGPETALNLSALLYAQRYYDQCARRTKSPETGDNTFWHRTGLLQLATTAKEVDRQTRFLERNQYPASVFTPVTAKDASELARLPLVAGGLWFPDSGWLDPIATCTWLLDHPGIRFRPAMTVTAISRNGTGWQLHFRSQHPENYSRVVIAAGSATPALLPGGDSYRLKPIRGQITRIPEQMVKTPSCVVCGLGYLNPAHKGYTTIGATFDLSGSDCDVTADDHQKNLEILESFQQQPLQPIPPAFRHLTGRASFRLTTHDYQPVAGTVPVTTDADHADGGLYVLGGFGSKGFALAPLLSEWLADRLTGQPECLTLKTSKRLQLARCKRPA